MPDSNDTSTATDTTPTPAPAPAGIAPVFVVVSFPATNVFTTLEDATAELQKQAAATPGTEFVIFESRRIGEAPLPAVVTKDVETV